ncbi:MAG: hypothetical protein ACR652_01245 [Methylocystis sp.]|uniref:hypothetical protein n=1 Tax=Methylocystis sp. TaxID=1911079 RepID=UPI003DA38B09
MTYDTHTSSAPTIKSLVDGYAALSREVWSLPRTAAGKSQARQLEMRRSVLLLRIAISEPTAEPEIVLRRRLLVMTGVLEREAA